MSFCDHVVDLTPEQASRVSELQRTAREVVAHMRKKYPFAHEWVMFEKWWNGRVFVGADVNTATFVNETGCLVVGIPKNGGKIAALNARLLLAMSTGSTNGKRCARVHENILDEATKMNIPFELNCDDIYEFGVSNKFKNAACHTSRIQWPEFVGYPAKNVVDAFVNAGYTVDVASSDTMYGKPPKSGVVRIIYDARTRQVSIAPHIGTMPLPSKEDECFLKADEGLACIGAPRSSPPGDWSAYVGKFFTEVVDGLRFRYPHATIEALPSTAGVSRDRRSDRIRVRFDPITARVASVPVIG